MSLYPSLEDLKVDQLLKAQQNLAFNYFHQKPLPVQPSAPVETTENKLVSLYPDLHDYMGLNLTLHQKSLMDSSSSLLVAPVSGSSSNIKSEQVNHAIREVILCKDMNNRIGLKIQVISKGVFIILVETNSPSALVGLRFGDQILQINGTNLAGFTNSQVNDLIKKCSPEKIVFVVRDRPFERSVTLHKSSIGLVGFTIKKGTILSLVKDSSAARNGLLTDHQLLEVDGRNVVGLKDREISKIMDEAGTTLTVTIMPSFIYDHMMKHISNSFVKKLMDHSAPNI